MKAQSPTRILGFLYFKVLPPRWFNQSCPASGRMALSLLLVALPWFVREALPNPRGCWSGSPLIRRSLSFPMDPPVGPVLYSPVSPLRLAFPHRVQEKADQIKGVKVNGLLTGLLVLGGTPVHMCTEVRKSRTGSRVPCPANTGDEA